MERFSWQVHFRNRYIIRRDWHSSPFSGTIEGGLVSPVFCCGHATSKRTSAKTSSRTSGHTSSAHSSSHTSSHTSAQSKNSHGKKGSKQAAKKRGQQVIDSDRAREIQEALIRERYMQGEPTGAWDDSTQAAMQRYQADQGWQSKTTPDARALIKLGLGPSHDHLLNPESAMTTPAAGDPKTAAKPTPADSNLPPQ
jgi:hypothetical protein